MKGFSIFVFMFLTALALSAQENTAVNDLLYEANTKLYAQPDQAGKLAEYIINQKENSTTTAEATLVLAKSFYVRGRYSDAIKNALTAKKIAYTTSDTELKIKTNSFAIKLLRELGLANVANKYSAELATQEIKNQDLIDLTQGSLKQDSAYVNFKQRNLSEAKQQLAVATTIFKKSDTMANFDTDVLLALINLKTGELEKAQKELVTPTYTYIRYQH